MKCTESYLKLKLRQAVILFYFFNVENMQQGLNLLVGVGVSECSFYVLHVFVSVSSPAF